MLQISSHYFDILEQIYSQDTTINSKEELGNLLQHALELEHSTIPPYLSAAYSLHTRNNSIRQLITRIAKEEMLHMTVVANLMNAIGIPPKFTNSLFMPAYPYTPTMLDMPGFELHIQSFSKNIDTNKQYIKDFFMRVEAPEHPQVFPFELMILMEKPKTIGLFYQKIIDIISEDRIPGLFDKAQENAWKQIVVQPKTSDPGIVYPNFKKLNVDGTLKDYPLQPGYDMKITNKDSAIKFLRWITDEGEGTHKDPIDEEGLAAHYYRFESIVHGKNLIVNPIFEEGYAYSGTQLSFDVTEGAIWEFDKPDPKQSDYVADPELFEAVKAFNMSYSNMLRYLEEAFTAETEEKIKEAYLLSRDEMINIPALAKNIRSLAPNFGKKGGLPFEYILPDT
jgi:hypothetical protein